jgi:hypothetical protein
MRWGVRAGVKAAFVAAVVISAQPINGLSDPESGGRHWAQRLQDDARVLRNAARVGRGAEDLLREHARMHTDLDELVRWHEGWVEELAAGERARLASAIREIERGCARMRAHLVDLGETLEAQSLDRRRIQLLGQAIGRQAWACERQIANSTRHQIAKSD